MTAGTKITRKRYVRPVDLVGEVFNYTIPSDKFSKNFATDSAAAQK